MSYTNQKINWEPCNGIQVDTYLIDSNNDKLIDSEGSFLLTKGSSSSGSIMDMYGDIVRPMSIEIRARKQPKEEVFHDYVGRELLSKSYFYVDPRVEPNALLIENEDKLDGETVKKKYVMCDLMGKPKMLRFITV